ncbi:hypothetical protein PAHAL_6G011000 [Panicum hallii]|uniref:SGNH hydrolase-type esterase domain-containing protein n=1 Tax=Panicum hallii TaxID=206008 RepID=A0A2S3HZN6_9POAL|nr:hypothetical protein PAHAL_6G011000 [Panicum hallii]
MAGGHCLRLLLLAVLAAAARGGGEERAPALFVFGDSLIDSGNNNNLASLAKANYFPYGIDFAGGPTGRFCNGYTIVDELAELLGLPLVPPYSQASSVQQVLQGANYASAAAGILDDSGGNFAGRIPFNQQIQNFESTVAQIAAAAGASAAAERLARSIVFVGMGSNDYLNNYLAPNYDTRQRYDPRQFADLLAHQFASQLTGRSQEVCGGRRGVDGVHPDRAGAERGGPVLAGGGRPRAAVQRQREGDARRPQRQPPRRPVHVPRQLPDLQSHPRQPGRLRVQRGGQGLLRHREERRADHVPAVHAAVRRPGALRVLGRVPPDGGGERHHRQGGLPRRRRRDGAHQRWAACQALSL